ncbi:MAG: hypothetical protein ACOYJN_00225 [Acutalibacteraceae bacterium]|jgi:HK97 family phage major capsid protein
MSIKLPVRSVGSRYPASEFARTIGVAEETAFVNGTGIGQPTDLLNATGGANAGVNHGSLSFNFIYSFMVFPLLKSPVSAKFVGNHGGFCFSYSFLKNPK